MDNYAEFLQRLSNAEASLKERKGALGHVRSIVSSALEDNNFGHVQWAERRARLEGLLGSQEVAGRSGLRELHAVAINMESVFRARSERVGARLAAVQNRIDEIDGPLHDLQISKERLTSSRKVAEEREKLSRAVLGVVGTTEGVATAIPDMGLRDDLLAAREAVVLAEALLELKGGQ
ncbi:hypothetical protein [Arthrobacter sp. NicSoilB8]|uniref:hypothetical protein n=1 Tax=Arthrobacter sp. NicSoilB8 TaxID=2830998 RepID=UPI001CC82287|nr:hypothetical protein [Arthrobacter sp. NicSoilB8]BCW71873.1 hypothetical protein NicSoilB8_29170 [Arthrobacter sp. NicSoilB8]